MLEKGAVSGSNLFETIKFWFAWKMQVPANVLDSPMGWRQTKQLCYIRGAPLQ